MKEKFDPQDIAISRRHILPSASSAATAMSFEPLTSMGALAQKNPAQTGGSGRVTGLCARLGFEVDISWKGGRKAVIHSKAGHPCRVVCGAKTWEFSTIAGNSYPLAPTERTERS